MIRVQRTLRRFLDRGFYEEHPARPNLREPILVETSAQPVILLDDVRSTIARVPCAYSSVRCESPAVLLRRAVAELRPLSHQLQLLQITNSGQCFVSIGTATAIQANESDVAPNRWGSQGHSGVVGTATAAVGDRAGDLTPSCFELLAPIGGLSSLPLVVHPGEFLQVIANADNSGRNISFMWREVPD